MKKTSLCCVSRSDAISGARCHPAMELCIHLRR